MIRLSQIIFISVCLLFVFILPGICKEKADPFQANNVPSLIDAVRFSGEMEFCGIKIALGDAEIRQRLEKELLLAVHNRPQVILWMKRSTQYFPHIERILKQENMPLDLRYVPMVESALLPNSNSSKGAVGYWQFLKSTGKRYGLRIDDAVDERRNIFKSTLAACYYLKKLNAEFDSYLLALSAYNMGEFGLNTEIVAQENKDFFSLYLPLETQRYVFKIMAVKMILEDPERYGFFLKPSDFYPEFRFSKIILNLNTKIPIVLVAKAANAHFKTIKDMNPEIRGYYLDPGKITLLIPEGKERGFKERFLNLYAQSSKNYKTKIHVVKPGESLTRIAEQYDMSLASLLRLNKFHFKKLIHPGDRLLVY